MAIYRDPVIIHNVPKTLHDGNVFRDGLLSLIVIGKSGCGKSQLVAQLLQFISKSIKYIFIATLLEGNQFHKDIQTWAKQHKIYCRVSHSPEELMGAIDLARERRLVDIGKDEGLLLCDDFSINNRSRAIYEDFVVHAFTRFRNYGWHFIIISQDPTMIATSVRNCSTSRILFNCASRSSTNTFIRDIDDEITTKPEFKTLLKYIKVIPYSYIFVKEAPIEVYIGKGLVQRKVMDLNEVSLPTYEEILNELGVSSAKQLTKKAVQTQKDMGNTAYKVANKVLDNE